MPPTGSVSGVGGGVGRDISHHQQLEPFHTKKIRKRINDRYRNENRWRTAVSINENDEQQ